MSVYERALAFFARKWMCGLCRNWIADLRLYFFAAAAVVIIYYPVFNLIRLFFLLWIYDRTKVNDRKTKILTPNQKKKPENNKIIKQKLKNQTKTQI